MTGRPDGRRDDPGRRRPGRAGRRRRRRRGDAPCWPPTPTRTSTSRAPTTSRRSRSADLVVASGGDLDAWIEDAIGRVGVRRRAPGPRRRDPNPREEDGELDPHWWHDPRTSKRIAPAIARRARRDSTAWTRLPSERGRRGPRQARPAESTRVVGGCLRAIPPADRKLVTDHDAFGYLADRYGIEIVGAVIPAHDDRGAAVRRRARGAARDDRARGREARCSPRAR